MEQELKYRLKDVEAYDKLAQALGKEASRVLQTNHYFDDQESSVQRAGGSAVRIRHEQEDGRELWELTFKVGRHQADGYFQALELNQTLEHSQAESLLRGGAWPDEIWKSAPMAEFERMFGRREMQPLGCSRNLRRRYPLYGETVELDRTEFPDGSVDFEVEIETDKPREATMKIALVAQRAGVELLHQQSTKFRRFMQRRSF